MPELLLPFPDKPSWDAWRQQHHPRFGEMRAEALNAIRAFGLMEPMTGLRRGPEEVTIAEGLRESISSHELNSRKRALLLVLETELRARGLIGRRNLRILAPEALSRAALILRGRYPYFHGAEYLPTAEERGRFFPVPHMDLQGTGLPDATFDVFFSGDVMEHVPDPEAAWAEIRRVLKPGGLIVSSFPFDPNRATTLVRARLGAGGTVEHLTAPEYHGNPVDPGGGSLVFALPGWDLLDRLREGGGDAEMVLALSAQHGVVSDGPPGVFVLSATTPSPAAPRPRPRLFHPGHLPDKLCTLLALPRSGTTLMTALFDVHSRFDAVFEPWNSKLLKGPEDATLPRLLAAAGLGRQPGRHLFIKETSADPAYIALMRRVLDQAPLPLDRSCLMLLRTPAHVFLSEVERRGEWWNDAVPLDAQQFDLWCAKSRAALRAMLAMVRAQDGSLVSYERMAEQPEAMLHRLARLIGFAVEPAQLEYEKHLDTRKVRGDVNVGTKPAPISAESVRRRAGAEPVVDAFAAESSHAPWFAAFRALHAAVTQAGVARARALPPALLEPLLAE